MTKNKKKGRPLVFGKDAPKIQVIIDIDLKTALDGVVKNQRTNISDFVRGLLIDNELIKEELKNV